MRATLASVLATVTVLVVGPAPSAQAGVDAATCSATSASATQWLGGAGVWSDASKWSGGQVPGLGSRDDEACIPTGSDVVVDGAAPRIDLEAFELGRGSVLELQPGTALFVWGDQQQVRSVSRPTSLIEVDGATLGGAGRLRVMGTLNVHRSTSGAPAFLSTRPASSSVSGRAGLLEIGDAGTLRVDGTGNVRLSKRYVVDVRGRALLRDDGGLKADHGTSFLLQTHLHTRGVGKLVILNDRGFAEGPWDGIRNQATFVNDGLVVKREATGVSRIDARYFGAGRVEEKSGDIFYVILVEHPPFTGPCGNAEFCNDEQEATVRIPLTDADGARVDVDPLATTVKGAVGVPLRVQVTDLETTVADPVVLRLSYTVSALRKAGAPSDPAKLDVARAEGPDDSFTNIPECARHAIPLGSTACLDRESSSRIGVGGVQLVVRTVQLSRWVAR